MRGKVVLVVGKVVLVVGKVVGNVASICVSDLFIKKWSFFLYVFANIFGGQ